MSSNTTDKRSGKRLKRELIVGVKMKSEIKMAYTIDLSRGGVKVGSPLLLLQPGDVVELIVKKEGESIPFTGLVARQDGVYYLNRIGKSVIAFFIRIADARFSKFVMDNYYV